MPAELDWKAWTPKLARYYGELLKAQSGRGGAHLHSLKRALRYGLTADLSAFGVEPGALFGDGVIRISVEGAPPPDAEAELALPDEVEEMKEGATESEEPPDDVDPAAAPSTAQIETLLRIARKQKGDPYNRETVLGYPVVGVRVGSKRFIGPLLLWQTEIEHVARLEQVRLRRTETTPSVNTVFLSKMTSDEVRIRQASEQLMPMVLDDDFGLEKVEELIRTFRGLFFEGRAIQELTFEGAPASSALRDILRDADRLSEDQPLLLGRRCILANGPRSQAFLLSDLAEIADKAEHEGESVLAQVVGRVPKEGAPPFDRLPLPFDDTGDGGSPLWFPFASNESQRAVAQIATRSQILTVQGPPGTGKSQTIANLVCHLVTEGHSVLVTSHQTKAMEVVSNMLSGFDGVALSMLKGDKESLQKLKTQLAGIRDTSAEGGVDVVEQAQWDLAETDAELRRLARRYLELSRMEHEEVPKFHRYADLREHDHLHPDDSPASEAPELVGGYLKEWAELRLKLGRALQALNQVYRRDGKETSRVRERGQFERLSALLRMASSLDEPISDAGRRVARNASRLEDGEVENRLRGLKSFIETAGPDMERELRDLGTDPGQGLAPWRAARASLAEDRLERWKEELDSLAKKAEASGFGSDEYPWRALRTDRNKISGDVGLLRKSTGFFRWHFFPDARAARQQLEEYGFPLRRRNATSDLSTVEGALGWAETIDRIGQLRMDIEERLPIRTPSTDRGIGSAPARRTLEELRLSIGVVSRIAELPFQRYDRLFDGVDAPSLEELTVEADRKRVVQLLDEALTWRERDRLIQELLRETVLEGVWAERVGELVESIRNGKLTEAAEDAAHKLRILQNAYPHFSRMLDLEMAELSGFRRSLAQLEQFIEEESDLPDWLDRAPEAVEAHRLGSLLRGSLEAHPDKLDEIAEALRRGKEARRKRIIALVERKRQLAAESAMQQPSTRVPLLALKKLLSKARLNNSLLALRDRIDYRAVLQAFPAWICTIDDAARLFPPAAGLFDYLIVDEASQCAQAVAMPLAYRAKRMIVVGDKKQLQPTASMFMPKAQVRLLQDEYGIAHHPKADFLDGQDSLLDLAEACSNAARMLDEHFRCDPAIIRWSNERYYDRRLKIMTRTRPGRARIPIEIVELSDADEDREKKVNRVEARAVVRAVRELVDSPEAKDKSIGVISLFRDQVNLIQELVYREFHDDPEKIDQHEIVASTADGFQGDERDIIFYSFRQGPSSHGGSITTIQRQEERLNVAFTRAKERAVCFISLPIHQFPNGAVRDFLEHAREEQNRAVEWDTQGGKPDQFDSGFEEEVCDRVRDQGLRVTTQVPCGRYRIDLVVEDSHGRELAVECDGEWKVDSLGQLRPKDYQRQDIIERAGWTVHRISGRKWLLNPEKELEKLLEALERQPTEVPDIEPEALAPPRELEDLEGREEVEEAERPGPPTHDEDELRSAAGQLPLSPIDTESPPQTDETVEEAKAEAEDELEGVRTRIFELARWVVLQPKVDWKLYGRLDSLKEQLEAGIPLELRQQTFVEKTVEWAEAQGFDEGEV